MKQNFDINRISGEGYIVFPLSMSRLGPGLAQDPKRCHEMLHELGQKLTDNKSDAVFLYTSGLYLNSSTKEPYLIRSDLNKRMVQHAQELRKIIKNDKTLIPSAIHFVPFDYIILNSNYNDLYARLEREIKSNNEFQKAILADTKGLPKDESNIKFILEELVVTHIIREGYVDLPKTLIDKDQWRLIVYPGPILESDKYQWQKEILPRKNSNKYNSGNYNYNDRVFERFNIG